MVQNAVTDCEHTDGKYPNSAIMEYTSTTGHHYTMDYTKILLERGQDFSGSQGKLETPSISTRDALPSAETTRSPYTTATFRSCDKAHTPSTKTVWNGWTIWVCFNLWFWLIDSFMYNVTIVDLQSELDRVGCIFKLGMSQVRSSYIRVLSW